MLLITSSIDALFDVKHIRVFLEVCYHLARAYSSCNVRAIIPLCCRITYDSSLLVGLVVSL